MQDLIFAITVVLGVLLVTGETATTTASFQYPNVDGLIVNNIDTVFLQWTSNYAAAYLAMWCQNGTTGNNVVLGSQFPVVTSGRFGYVLTNEDPAQVAFPVACHAQLVPTPGGAGVDSPFGITFTSQLKVAAETFSLSSTTTLSSNSATTTSTSALSTSKSSSSSSSANSVTSSITTTSSSTLLASTTRTGNNTTGTAVPTDTPTSASSTQSSTAATNASSSGASSDHLGAIIGGILGGLALLSFVIFGALFLRKYRQKDDKLKNDQNPSSSTRLSRGWWHRNYRTTPMQTGGLHEIEGSSPMRHEKEGDAPPLRHEKEGDLANIHEIDGRAKSKRWTRYELPT